MLSWSVLRCSSDVGCVGLVEGVTIIVQKVRLGKRSST